MPVYHQVDLHHQPPSQTVAVCLHQHTPSPEYNTPILRLKTTP